MQEQSESGEKKRTSTSALVFDNEKTGISIGDQDTSEAEYLAVAKTTVDSKQPGLPF